jgi:2-polyprenyl-6-methoxyphenol hydroxylase-like FAD-dependent oxidoreductase
MVELQAQAPRPVKPATTVETPVLIVGGGPVGMCLALELSWRGISSVLVERTDGRILHPKTAGITHRTMEFCRRWGIEDKVRGCGFPVDWHLNMVFATGMSGHLLARTCYPSLAEERPPPQSPQTKWRAPQLFFDPLLAEEVRSRDLVTFRRRCELVSFEQDASSVHALISDLERGEQFQVHAKYLVACDGALSEVRSALGIPMEGNPVLDYSMAIFIRARELVRRHDKGEAERYIFLGPEGTWGNLTVVDGSELWRLTVLGSRHKIDLAAFDAEFWVRRCMGSDSIPFEIIDVLPWRRSQLVAQRFSAGRVFLAGDAAHTMSPTGGFGYNTGVCDVVDLGWKIEAVLRGWGGAALLGSYEQERKPIAIRNVAAAAQNYHALVSAKDCQHILEDTALGAAERSRTGAHIEAATRNEWENLGIVLGFRYEGSPICVPDGTPEPADDVRNYVQTSRPGHRAPHAWLAPNRSTLDLFGRGFVLLSFPGAPDPAPFVAAAQARAIPLTVVAIEDEAAARLYERKLVLVRPDGHSAWRGDAVPENIGAVMDRVRGVFAIPLTASDGLRNEPNSD